MSRLQKLFWISLVIKLLLGAILPLTSDESYYWVWSHHLDWSYYDHPAMISWLFWLGHPLENILSLVRWPGILLSHATIYIWLQIFRPWLNEQQKELWLWLALLSPLLGGSAFVITPDVPLLFFWALSTLAFFGWSQNPSRNRSILFGLMMGLGFSSKYVMVLFPLCVLPVILFAPSWRRAFLRNFHWIFFGGVIGIAPVLIWNIQHDFASIRFQLSHGLGRKFWKPRWTIDYVLLQAMIIFPMLLYFAIRGARKTAPIWTYLSFVPLVFFLVTSYRGYVEANWPIVSYPALFYLAVVGSQGREHLVRWVIGFWAALFILLTVVIFYPWSQEIRQSKLREFFQYDELAAVSHEFDPLRASSYQMASSLSFKQKRMVNKLAGMNRRDFFDSLAASSPPKGPSDFYLARKKGESLPSYYEYLTPKIEVIKEVDEFEIVRVRE